MGARILDEEVNGSDVQHDTSIGKRVDDGLDALVARFADLDEPALLDAVERLGGVLVLHPVGHVFRDLIFQFSEVDETIDGAHQIDVQETGALVGRTGSNIQFVPDSFESCHFLARLVTTVDFAENILPNIGHVEVPHEDLHISSIDSLITSAFSNYIFK